MELTRFTVANPDREEQGKALGGIQSETCPRHHLNDEI
jgi:hypothetical protein